MENQWWVWLFYEFLVTVTLVVIQCSVKIKRVLREPMSLDTNFAISIVYILLVLLKCRVLCYQTLWIHHEHLFWINTKPERLPIHGIWLIALTYMCIQVYTKHYSLRGWIPWPLTSWLKSSWTQTAYHLDNCTKWPEVNVIAYFIIIKKIKQHCIPLMAGIQF